MFLNLSIRKITISKICRNQKVKIKTKIRTETENKKPVSLLDNKPLRLLLHNIVDLQRIDRNIQGGYLSSVSVTASSYNTGDSITFFQGNEAKEWRRAKRCGQKTLLGIHHLLASAAIPLVFPSVRINQHYYGDGSVNQLSPLSSPIHLGAEKILIIGLEQPRARDLTNAMPHHPGLATVAGHLLDTIFSTLVLNTSVFLLVPLQPIKEMAKATIVKIFIILIYFYVNLFKLLSMFNKKIAKYI